MGPKAVRKFSMIIKGFPGTNDPFAYQTPRPMAAAASGVWPARGSLSVMVGARRWWYGERGCEKFLFLLADERRGIGFVSEVS